MNSKPLRAISFFSGAGGLDCGAIQAGKMDSGDKRSQLQDPANEVDLKVFVDQLSKKMKEIEAKQETIDWIRNAIRNPAF